MRSFELLTVRHIKKKWFNFSIGKLENARAQNRAIFAIAWSAGLVFALDVLFLRKKWMLGSNDTRECDGCGKWFEYRPAPGRPPDRPPICCTIKCREKVLKKQGRQVA